MISSTRDPDGRRVVLREGAWAHIRRRHPSLRSRLREIMACVRAPVVRVDGRDVAEVWYIAEDAGRYPWLHVVVHYEGGEGWIVTAFPRSVLPSA